MPTPTNTTPSSPIAGLNRRTLVQGVAWTVPAIGVAIAAPTASASAALTLTFDQPNYNLPACGSTNVTVTVTSPGGAPAVGEPVTVQLPAGITSNGSQTVNAVTDGAGQIIFPITTGNVAQTNIPLIATSGASTGQATATTGSTSGEAVAFSGTAVIATYPAVPDTAQAVGPAYYLAPNGDLYYGNSLITTGVAAGRGFVDNSNANVVEVVQGTSLNRYVNGSGPQLLASNVPAGSTPLTSASYLTTDGRVFYGNTLLESGVTSAEAFRNVGGTQDVIDLIKGTEVRRSINGGATTVSASNVASGSVIHAPTYYVTPAGDLFFHDTLVTSGVTSADAFLDFSNNAVIDVLQNGNLVRYLNGASPQVRATNVAPGSTVFAPDNYLTPDGRLFNDNSLIDTGIQTAAAFRQTDGTNRLYTVRNEDCV